MKSILALLLISLVTVAHSVGQKVEIPNDIENSNNVLNLNPYTKLTRTPITSYTPQEFLSKKWQHAPRGGVFGISDKVQWMRYDFYNHTIDWEYVLYIPYHHIYEIDVFQLAAKKLRKIHSSGTKYPDSLKSMKSRGYPVKIKIPSGQSTIFVRLNHLYMPLRGSAFLLSNAKTHDKILRNETAIWFWRGLFLFALIISFVLYLYTRIRLFLFYFLLNAGVALFIGMEIGDFFMFFPADPYNFIIDIKHLGNILVILFFPLFLNELTPIRKLQPTVWKIMMIGIFIMPLLWLLCLIPPLKNSLLLYATVAYFIAISSIVFLLQIYFLSVALLRRKRNALILLFTYFFYITAVAFNVILPNLGMKADELLVYNTLMYGSIFEILTFMILMGRETLIIYKEHAMLLEKQKMHQAEIIKAMVESQEIERNKVGRELHDMIGANISVIRQQVNKTNKTLLSVIDHTIESVRRLSHGLVTPMIKKDEFADEIRELCLMFSGNGLTIQPYFHNWKGLKNTDMATHLYRIVQELLQNTVKHSQASHVTVQFLVDYNRNLTLIYEDNGKGFNYEKQRHSGLGLINIENRVKLIHGKLSFDTKPGGTGTTVIIEI
ncbi:MAG: hypothetical protein K9J27_06880 [Bacteroidales bacterium]|nr:hypothetical protein [Bacteroidales bacterium]MCF8333712.1 hypothetical protein [Bacteroidales bacterium]